MHTGLCILPTLLLCECCHLVHGVSCTATACYNCPWPQLLAAAAAAAAAGSGDCVGDAFHPENPACKSPRFVLPYLLSLSQYTEPFVAAGTWVKVNVRKCLTDLGIDPAIANGPSSRWTACYRSRSCSATSVPASPGQKAGRAACSRGRAQPKCQHTSSSPTASGLHHPCSPQFAGVCYSLWACCKPCFYALHTCSLHLLPAGGDQCLASLSDRGP
jgi:hypothetical protein